MFRLSQHQGKSMDILTGAVQSYQKNQNLTGWVDQAESTNAISGTLHEDNNLSDDSISISEQRKIYEWMAQKFPQQLNTTVNINRVNQALYEYQVLTLRDLNSINALIAEPAEFNIMEKIESAHFDSESFSERQQLQHIKQVYSTLLAAQETQAA
jgi:hypothetical protein